MLLKQTFDIRVFETINFLLQHSFVLHFVFLIKMFYVTKKKMKFGPKMIFINCKKNPDQKICQKEDLKKNLYENSFVLLQIFDKNILMTINICDI